MSTASRCVAGAAAGVLILLTGCATTGGSLSSSAERLERGAQQMARNSRAASMESFSRDAGQLADEARDFRQTVHSQRADDRDVRRAFDDLSRDYHALRDEVDRSNSREARADFARVTDAYLDIERQISRNTRDDRYARDRDRDRRY